MLCTNWQIQWGGQVVADLLSLIYPFCPWRKSSTPGMLLGFVSVCSAYQTASFKNPEDISHEGCLRMPLIITKTIQQYKEAFYHEYIFCTKGNISLTKLKKCNPASRQVWQLYVSSQYSYLIQREFISLCTSDFVSLSHINRCLSSPRIPLYCNPSACVYVCKYICIHIMHTYFIHI